MCTIYTICPFPPICCLPYGIQTYWVGFCILKNITQIYVICCSFYSTVIEQKNVAFQQKSKRTLPIDPRLHVQHPSENVIDYPTRPLRAVGWQCWGERARQGMTSTPKDLSPRQWCIVKTLSCGTVLRYPQT